MAVIADRCPQIQVTVVDLNAERIAAWNDSDLSKLPVYEPGLDAVVARRRGRNLHFSTAVEAAIAATGWTGTLMRLNPFTPLILNART